MNPAHDLDQAISAASLVLAVLAALYTLWLGEVGRVLAIEPDPDIQNRKPQKKTVTWAFLTKGLPLFLASGAAVGVIAPRTTTILEEVASHGAEWGFDDVKAFFVLTAALLAIITLVAAGQAFRLLAKRLDLNG